MCFPNVLCILLNKKSDFVKGSIAAHHALRSDPRLFKDDVDIRFSRTLNSCKLPQIRYATPERLLQRLTGKRVEFSYIFRIPP